MLLILISVVSAEPSRITTGSYNISFDLNTSKNYSVEVMSPLEGNNYTSYAILINASDQIKAGIYIMDSKTPEDATLSTQVSIYKGYTHDIPNASVEIREIDGKDGFIGYYVDPKNRQAFLGKYWLDSKEVDESSLYQGSIEVKLFGTMPRNSTEGTAIAKSLIDTIHIEKIANQSEQAAKNVVSSIRSEPYISVYNQNVEDNQGNAIIDEVLSDGPGWVVIYNDKYIPYSKSSNYPIGYTHVSDGLNKIVEVQLNMALVTDKLYAVLFKDEGQVGEFEYPGPDFPRELHAEKLYSFNSKWPNPMDDFRIGWQEHASTPGPNWM
jgi:hypothetical protein